MKTVFTAAVAASIAGTAVAVPLPQIISQNGKHELLVDGAPFLVLGGQANNSSNYPSVLPNVLQTIKTVHANTLEIPVAWEQIEPVEGRFDFSWVDTLVSQAHANGVRLDLLWFGTWKNTNGNYRPEWVKSDTARFPHMMTKDGKSHYVPTPLSRNGLEADKRAFVALMRHIRDIDPDHTVILVQVENETGTYDSPRDFSPEANRLFNGPIPPELARKTGKSGTWTQAFGKGADRAFTAWYVARYVDEIAAAGQAELNLPMYVNAALGDAFTDTGQGNGGPDWPVIDIWKAGAPHIAIEAPDIYGREEKGYSALINHFNRPDNPLLIPETGNDLPFARYLWLALGNGAIGWSPFGMDTTYFNYPLGAKDLDAENLDALASKYALMAPIARDWARLAFEHSTTGFAKPEDGSDQSSTMGRWKITAQYGLWEFGLPTWTFMKFPPNPKKDKPVGGASIVQLGPDEFLVAGSDVRVSFGLANAGPNENSQILDVEEGTFKNGQWVMARRWNGDQTDYGLNLDQPTLLKVRLGTYR